MANIRSKGYTAMNEKRAQMQCCPRVAKQGLWFVFPNAIFWPGPGRENVSPADVADFANADPAANNAYQDTACRRISGAVLCESDFIS